MFDFPSFLATPFQRSTAASSLTSRARVIMDDKKEYTVVEASFENWLKYIYGIPDNFDLDKGIMRPPILQLERTHEIPEYVFFTIPALELLYTQMPLSKFKTWVCSSGTNTPRVNSAPEMAAAKSEMMEAATAAEERLKTRSTPSGSGFFSKREESKEEANDTEVDRVVIDVDCSRSDKEHGYLVVKPRNKYGHDIRTREVAIPVAIRL